MSVVVHSVLDRLEFRTMTAFHDDTHLFGPCGLTTMDHEGACITLFTTISRTLFNDDFGLSFMLTDGWQLTVTVVIPLSFLYWFESRLVEIESCLLFHFHLCESRLWTSESFGRRIQHGFCS